jgi:hypothetical protein
MIDFMRGPDLSDVPMAMAQTKPGARVRVRFDEQPEGRITDSCCESVR